MYFCDCKITLFCIHTQVTSSYYFRNCWLLLLVSCNQKLTLLETFYFLQNNKLYAAVVLTTFIGIICINWH